jgi:hypothetical protein
VNPSYLAGFFDGEGCVKSFIVSTHPQIMLEIAQKDPSILYHIQEYLGYGKVQVIHSRGRESHQLRIYGRDRVRQTIRLIYPHSIIKKQQLELGYRLAGLIEGPGERVSKTKARQRMDLHHALREAKRGRV